MVNHPFKRKTAIAVSEQPRRVTRAYTIGDEMFTDGEDIPQSLRSTVSREMKALQRGASGVSDAGLAQAVKLSVPAMTCVNYIGSNAASIPLVVKKNEITKHHPFDHFLSNSNQLMEDSVKSYVIFGKIYLQKIYNERDTVGNPRGFPTGLKYINPNNITQVINDQTKMITSYKLRLENNREIPASDVIYIPDFSPSGDGNPLSKLENAFIHLGVEQGVANYAMSFFLNSALPVGIVSFEPAILPDQYATAKRQWKKEFQGGTNAYKTGFTNGGIKWTPITSAPKDLAMGELTDNSKQMICAAFSTPPELVGLADNTGSSLSAEQKTAAQRIYLEGFIIPLVQKILEALNRQWLWVDFSAPAGFYNLATNAMAMPIFSQVTVDRVSMTNELLAAGTINYNQQLELLALPMPELEEGEIRLTAPLGNASKLWNDGVISMNKYLVMVGLETIEGGNVHNINNVIVASPSDAIQKELPLPSVTPPPDITENVLEATPSALSDSSVIEMLGTLDTTLEISPPTRSDTAIDLAVDFAGHAFVAMAQRHLAKLIDGHTVDWVDSGNWRLPLIGYQNCIDNNVRAVMNGLDIDSQNIELKSAGYRVHDGAIYYAIETNKELSLLRSSLGVRLKNNAGMSGDSAPMFGVKLCDVGDAAITDEMITDNIMSAPLVVDRVSVYINGALSNSWRIQRVTQEQRSELTQWRSKLKTSAKRGIAETDVVFDVGHLPQHVVDYIHEHIVPGCDTTEVFAEARRRLAVRAIQSTLVDFELFMEDILTEARAGNLPRPRFTRQLRNAINRFGAAGYRDGLVDGGVLDATLTDDDIAIQDELIADNQSFAKELSARVYSKDGISDEEAASRPTIWGKTIVRILYDAGRLSADKNGMYELVQASTTVDKCPDCKRLLGQVHRFVDWAKRNLLMPHPGKQDTECGGWKCGHTQVKVDARASGSF